MRNHSKLKPATVKPGGQYTLPFHQAIHGGNDNIRSSDNQSEKMNRMNKVAWSQSGQLMSLRDCSIATCGTGLLAGN